MKRENGTEGEGKKMAVWGIGAYNPKNNEDKAKQFVEKGKIEIGYTEEEKLMFYRLLKSIEYGDLVFIKARYRYDKPLTIKAIGLATEIFEKDSNGSSKVEVCWISDFTNNPRRIQSENECDGSINTIYQERDPKIIREIIKIMNEEAEE